MSDTRSFLKEFYYCAAVERFQEALDFSKTPLCSHALKGYSAKTSEKEGKEMSGWISNFRWRLRSNAHPYGASLWFQFDSGAQIFFKSLDKVNKPYRLIFNWDTKSILPDTDSRSPWSLKIGSFELALSGLFLFLSSVHRRENALYILV